MKVAHPTLSNCVIASVFAMSLFLAPPPIEAKLFGYTNLKAGYSYEGFSKTTFVAATVDKSAYLKASSASDFPFGASVGVGYYFTPSFGFRFEAEYTYRLGVKFKENALRTNDPMNPVSEFSMRPQTKIQGLLGNVYLDYYVTQSVNLYLGGGVGSSLLKAEIDYRKTTDQSKGKLTALKKSALAWQVGGGMGVALGQNLGLDFNVRYADFGKAKFNPTASLSASANVPFSAIETFIGLSYRF